jgi:hypothetical protein
VKRLLPLLLAACSAESPPPVAYAPNPEPTVPSACYARTGASNTCWTCHADGVGPNTLQDAELQAQYDFSDAALENHWANAFEDRRAAIARISDEEILRWVREDNYGPLVAEFGLDLARGFDADGFARDGSGWRAVRYQPFPGVGWPERGSIGDVFVRLPRALRAHAKENLEILAAAIGGIEDLPETYEGSDVAVEPLVYPAGTELLHSVRYLDPDAPGGMATRMKELRWMRKDEAPDAWARQRAYEREADEADEGRPPEFRGDARTGYVNAFGWRMRGFIEDARGALRPQTDEEHRFCIGCHQGLGVTVDNTFSLARKVPGADGWRPQDLRGLVDRPQVGHTTGEIATYRARAGEPPPRDGDLATILLPPRDTALALDKAYLLIVREQSFARGRDATIAPADAHRTLAPSTTAADTTYRDARLHLAW